MYKNQRRYKPNTGTNKQNFRRGGQKRTIKKLNSSLFVQSASATELTNYVPTLTFADFELLPAVQANITDHGYDAPTEIQEKTIKHVLEGKDVIGIANTGTGKTAAFLIPLINIVMENRDERVFIVAPTRELAMQILDEFRIFTKGTDIDAGLLIGGSNIQIQEKRMYKNPNFVIGTPGRIKDFIKRRRLNLQAYQHVVLDEVDQMVDIGFIKDIEYFISLLPAKRQSLFFSATVSDKVKSILHSFVTNPVTISIKKQETAANVEQDIVRVSGSNKIDTLHNLLTQEAFEKVLIFGRTKWGIEKLTRDLITRGFRATAIHGNKSQGQRKRSLEEFKTNKVKILLATDVASRGLDIENVTHVINYDPPETYDDYVHRIGRTGRAGRSGTALTFVE